MSRGEKVRSFITSEIKTLKQGDKFSLKFDEWTSSIRWCMAVNVHQPGPNSGVWDELVEQRRLKGVLNCIFVLDVVDVLYKRNLKSKPNAVTPRPTTVLDAEVAGIAADGGVDNHLEDPGV